MRGVASLEYAGGGVSEASSWGCGESDDPLGGFDDLFGASDSFGALDVAS